MAEKETEKKGLHDGHRERMREEFLKYGFNSATPEHKMLEMLLFHCIPRTDTNDLAHMLLNRFHNLAGVLDAPIEELCEFPKLTRSNATLLKLIMPVARKYIEIKDSSRILGVLKAGFRALEKLRVFLDNIDLDERDPLTNKPI